MAVEITVFNAQRGDRKKLIDTSDRRKRRKLKDLIDEKKKDGAAIIAKLDEDLRVDGYDDETDELIVRGDKPRSESFRVPAKDAKVFVIPPTAGG
jgi:hypothetical protein